MIKEKIGFKQIEYNDALYTYESKKFLKEKIVKELKALNNNFSFKDCYNVVNEFYAHLEKTLKNSNPLKLKGTKLTELLELDLTNLEISVKNYVRTDQSNPMQPDVNDFIVYAESELELERFNDSNDFINVLRKFDKYELNFTRKQDLVAFTPFAIYNQEKSDYDVNCDWIKQK